MDLADRAISRVINMIDWTKIKGYHKKLGILWEFEYDKETIRRIPNVPELKEELRSLLVHMKEENLSYISHGTWVVFWEREKSSVGDIRVIFRIVDFHFEENTHNKESMEAALKKALEREDYEYAAILRDEMRRENENTTE